MRVRGTGHRIARCLGYRVSAFLDRIDVLRARGEDPHHQCLAPPIEKEVSNGEAQRRAEPQTAEGTIKFGLAVHEHRLVQGPAQCPADERCDGSGDAGDGMRPACYFFDVDAGIAQSGRHNPLPLIRQPPVFYCSCQVPSRRQAPDAVLGICGIIRPLATECMRRCSLFRLKAKAFHRFTKYQSRTESIEKHNVFRSTPSRPLLLIGALGDTDHLKCQRNR
ncbi:hypothetical protein NOVOSPHI9U_350047 [Novosphingobium sp. 9U]|nr:hypothetical protein NOVOSPHI9U_350047 [Novosphingobium sp. 9U]